jgi:hypothetical protein
MALLIFQDSGALMLRELVLREGHNIFNTAADLERFIHGELWQKSGLDDAPEEVRRALRRYQEAGPQWFRQLVIILQFSMQSRLADCVKEGAALIMARHGSVLAPFERVWPDQWAYFKVTTHSANRCLDDPWYDPKLERYDPCDYVAPACTAVGSNDERLYSIHVAPGKLRARRRADGNAEKSCIDFLIAAMKRSPEHPPGGTVAKTRARCLEMFAGLSGRGFEDAYSYAKKRYAEVTGHECRWSAPGRKSIAQIAAVEGMGAVISALPRRNSNG